jgi:hypothetical protein
MRMSYTASSSFVFIHVLAKWKEPYEQGIISDFR